MRRVSGVVALVVVLGAIAALWAGGSASAINQCQGVAAAANVCVEFGEENGTLLQVLTNPAAVQAAVRYENDITGATLYAGLTSAAALLYCDVSTGEYALLVVSPAGPMTVSVPRACL